MKGDYTMNFKDKEYYKRKAKELLNASLLVAGFIAILVYLFLVY
jgi:5-hydroxyisourate hydrolase-like protein (transthyretin family)